MNEDFVTYEIAVKLKKLGFDLPCWEFYTKDVKLPSTEIKPLIKPKDWNNIMIGGRDRISAPTLARAQKWLREVHGIHIAVIGNYDCGGNLNAFEVWLQGVSGGRQVLQYETKKLSDYESALSAGIEAALKLIEEGKK